MDYKSEVDSMRAKMQEISRENAIVGMVFDMASHLGLSGEDKYAILSYRLIEQNKKLEELLIDNIQTIPPRMMFLED